MRTDELFYEVFKLDPSSLFRLIGAEMNGEYQFSSITQKSVEKRMDGFFRNTSGTGPNVFLEVQGYYDKYIYWRLIREICMWHEDAETHTPFFAVFIFVDPSFDPDNCPFSCVSPNRMIRCHLEQGLRLAGGNAGALTALKPLVIEDEKMLFEQVPIWKGDISALDLGESEKRLLIELLIYAILQRFPSLTLKEVEQMIQLTPLEKTTAVRELLDLKFEQGIERGIEQGIERGIEQGIERGIEQGIEQSIRRLLAKGFSGAEVARLMDVEEAAVLQIAAKLK